MSQRVPECVFEFSWRLRVYLKQQLSGSDAVPDPNAGIDSGGGAAWCAGELGDPCKPAVVYLLDSARPVSENRTTMRRSSWLAEAALPSLTIVIVGVVPIVLLSRVVSRTVGRSVRRGIAVKM